MSNAIHHAAAGPCHFFTIRLANRHSNLLIREISVLRNAMRETKLRHPFHIDAICVLPATLHMLLTLPQGEQSYTTRIAMLKSRFSRAMPMPANRTLKQIKRGEKGLWQRSHWSHHIKDKADFERHRQLIHLSPVHAGLCSCPQDWAHTSFHRDLKYGHAQPAGLIESSKAVHKPQTPKPVPQDPEMRPWVN